MWLQQQDNDNYNDKKKQRKKERKNKMKRSPMEAFPLAPRSSLITHGKRNG
jgi:hypothetical protein